MSIFIFFLYNLYVDINEHLYDMSYLMRNCKCDTTWSMSFLCILLIKYFSVRKPFFLAQYNAKKVHGPNVRICVSNVFVCVSGRMCVSTYPFKYNDMTNSLPYIINCLMINYRKHSAVAHSTYVTWLTLLIEVGATCVVQPIDYTTTRNTHIFPYIIFLGSGNGATCPYIVSLRNLILIFEKQQRFLFRNIHKIIF